MPVYKLTYFKGRGRAEVPRMLFTMAGQEFQDIRLEGESWTEEFKPKTPMGQLPVLEIDDVMICQSNAISRFVANKFGFAGKTDLDKARADMVVDCMDDMAKPLITVFSAKSDEEKAAIKTKFTTEQAPEFLTKLEKILELNKNGDGWFVGDDITWADVQFYNVIDFPESQMGLSMGLDKFKKLSALKKRVEDHPKIQEWIAKRP